jgi:hypothetical protein
MILYGGLGGHCKSMVGNFNSKFSNFKSIVLNFKSIVLTGESIVLNFKSIVTTIITGRGMAQEGLIRLVFVQVYVWGYARSFFRRLRRFLAVFSAL